MRDTSVHTWHAECPCHRGGEPLADFTVAERVLPISTGFLVALAILAERYEHNARERSE